MNRLTSSIIGLRVCLATAVSLLSLAVPFHSDAQELKADVEVNASAIEGTNRSVFETLQSSISEYLNNTAWSNLKFSPNEKIECRFYFTMKEYKDDHAKGDLQIQLSRPVYNSSYTTTLFNFKDTKIEFDYREGDPLVFNENSFDNNLTGILNFYAYMMLALDCDTFSPNGGQPFYDRAASVVQLAQSSGETGWKAFDDNKNRAALLAAYTDANTSGMRRLLYNYHRKGLDEMSTSPDKGRAQITESLGELAEIQKAAPMSVGLSIFRDSKLDELVNIYSKAPQSERDKAYEILSPIYPTDTERLGKIKLPDEQP